MLQNSKQRWFLRLLFPPKNWERGAIRTQLVTRLHGLRPIPHSPGLLWTKWISSGLRLGSGPIEAGWAYLMVFLHGALKLGSPIFALFGFGAEHPALVEVSCGALLGCTRPQEFNPRVGDRIHRGVCGSPRLCPANEGGLGARRPHALLQGTVSLSFGQMAGEPPFFLLVFSRCHCGLRSRVLRQI